MLIKLIEFEDDYSYYNQQYSFTVIGLLNDNIKVRIFVERPLTNINEVKGKEIKCVLSAHDVKEIRVLKKKEDIVPVITANHIKGNYIEKYEFPHIWLKLNNDILNKDYYSAIDIGNSHILIDPYEFKAISLKDGDFIHINYRILNLRAWSTIEDYQSKEEELRKKKEKKAERLGKKKSFHINDYMTITLQKEKRYGSDEYELRTNLSIKDKWFYCGVEDVEFPAMNISKTLHPDKIAKRREWFMSYPEKVECPVTDNPESAQLDKIAEEYDSKQKERRMQYTTWSKGYKGIQAEKQYEILTNNLQIWYEQNYDTRLLRCRYAFKLLKELCKAGDPLAKKVFKKEVINRLLSGYPTVVNHLLDYDYLKYLNSVDLLEKFKEIASYKDIFKLPRFQFKNAKPWIKLGIFLKLREEENLIFGFYDFLAHIYLLDKKYYHYILQGLKEPRFYRFVIELARFTSVKAETLDDTTRTNLNIIICICYYNIHEYDNALEIFEELMSKEINLDNIGVIYKKIEALYKEKQKILNKGIPNEEDYRVILTDLLNIPKSKNIQEIIDCLSSKGGFDELVTKKIKNLLNKLKLQYPDYYYTISHLIENAEITKFKSFYLDVSYDGEHFYKMKIYCNNKLIFDETGTYINILTFKQGITEDVKAGWDNDIMATGCGHYGCCPGLVWDLVHKDDHIIINNIHWSGKPEEYCPIGGEYKVLLKDYQSEVKRLEKMLEKLR